jgi:hypothetical protein
MSVSKFVDRTGSRHAEYFWQGNWCAIDPELSAQRRELRDIEALSRDISGQEVSKMNP